MKNKFLIVFIIFSFNASVQAVTPAAKVPAAKTPVVLKPVSTASTTQLKGQVASVPPVVSAPPVLPVQPQPVDFGVCNKNYKLNSEKLFYLTLAGVNANRFKIDELQSKSGFVLFTAAKRQFLASVIRVDAQSSMLKITPCDNIYYFPIGIVQNMFKYVELNLATPLEKLPVL